MGDPYFDAYYASTVEFLNNSAVYQQTTVRAAGAALLDRIGKPVVLIAHSQGALMPWLIVDVRPKRVHSIIAIEPTGPPFREAIFSTTAMRAYGLTDAPLTYDPPVHDPAVDLVERTIISNSSAVSNCTLQSNDPPSRQLVDLKGIPVMVLTTEASYHVPYDCCTVRYLRQAGVNTTHLNLPDVGIHGNSHMIFMEKNSGEVAEKVKEWIQAS